MPGRAVSVPPPRRKRPGRGLVPAAALATLTLLALGIVIGSRFAAPQEPTGATTAASLGAAGAEPLRAEVASRLPTRAGAVRAAARSITAFGADVLLDPARLRALVERIASAASQSRLIAAFDQASAQTRAKLRVDTVPRPVIVLRAVPVGYRVERFSADAATVAVWYVGIVGSGASVQPQQSWRTQIVSLVWEDGGWQVSSFASSTGPTPPLSTADIGDPAGALFAAIPRFEEFERGEP